MTSDIGFILEHLEKRASQPALCWRTETRDGRWIVDQVRRDIDFLASHGIVPGSVVLLNADYSPRTVSLLLALIELKAIIAPLLPLTLSKTPSLMEIVNPSFQIIVDAEGETEIRTRVPSEVHPLVLRLQENFSPGLILFTSGTSGKPKGVVHNFALLLVKFHKQRPAMRTLNFLLFDHWGGLNTLLHCLSSGSAVVLPESRQPEYICAQLEFHKVELLPASPTFLKMLLLSKAYESRDLSSLRLISYGSEPMPTAILAGLRASFPTVEFRQTYGLIELGVLRAKSLSSDSLWVKVGGEGCELRVVDGILQIKTESAMLGYLNAIAPFTEDGYFITGDRVELKGEYMRFLGRDSELINVGGQKVFPIDVETVLLECDLVDDAVVYGTPHPLMGTIVCADIQLHGTPDEAEARRIIKRFCADKLDSYKIPVKIRFVEAMMQSDRFKRTGRAQQPAEQTNS